MFCIVAHHFVVNSGVMAAPSFREPINANGVFLLIFGMWGKTGINCFLMITGYYMCKSSITLRKFVKLLLWIYLYKFIIFGIFYFTGYETITLTRLAQIIMPIWGIKDNFTSCFLAFWLTIPFWNILTQNMTQRQHLTLTALLLLFYTIFGSIPHFDVQFNYVTWFGIIYLISSYIRLYPSALFQRKGLWMKLSLLTIIMAMTSVIVCHYESSIGAYFFVADSNRLLAVAVAISTFLWFKNINLPYNKFINIVGGTTFGVLLIHANSDAMRKWLWVDTVDCFGHSYMSFPKLFIFAFGSVALIFFACSAIDRLRQLIIEKPFFKWYDKK